MMVRQAASLYERAVSAEETAERHVLLAEALVLAERKNEALLHFGRAADLYDDRNYKASVYTRKDNVVSVRSINAHRVRCCCWCQRAVITPQGMRLVLCLPFSARRLLFAHRCQLW